MPITTRMKTPELHAYLIADDVAHVLNRTSVFGDWNIIAVGKGLEIAAFDKTLLSGGKSSLRRKLLIRAFVIAAACRAVPYIKGQKPFLLQGSMSGNCQSKQQAGGNQGFHGSAPQSDDAVDALDNSITAIRTHDTAPRTDRADVQDALPQRRVLEHAAINAEHSGNTSDAGFSGSMSGKDKGNKQQASGNEGFHGAPFCYGADLGNTHKQYNLG